MFNLQKETDESKLAVRRWVTLFLSLIMFSTMVVYYIIAVLIDPLHDARGWSVGSLLFVYTLTMVTSTPAAIIGGKIRDVFGDRAIILLGSALYGIGFIIGGLTSNMIVFFITVGVMAAAGYNFNLCGFAHTIGVLFPDKNGLAMGLFYGGLNGIGVFLIPATAYLAGTFSSTVTLLLLGIVAAVVCIALTPLIAVPPENYKPKGWDRDTALAENPESSDIGEVQANWRKLLKMPSAYLIMLAVLFAGLIGEALNSNFSLVAQEMVHLNPMAAAWIGSVILVGTAVGNIGMGAIADKIGAIKSTMFTVVLEGIIVAIGLTIGMSVMLFSAVAFMVGLGMGVMQALLPVITMKSYGEKNFGVNFGVLSLLIPVASFIGPQMTVLMPLTNYFAVCIGACILSGIMFFFAGKSVEKFKKSRS